MKSWFFAALIGLGTSAVMAGCALEQGLDTETTTSDAPENTGTVRLDLQGTAPNGTVYRLRQATFTISTTPPTTLSSEASPANVTALTAQLPAGSYSVTLQSGWLLDRVNNMGVAQPVVANLVSANPAMAGVQVGTTSSVNFQFQTSGVLITTGTLNIGIGVTEVDGGTPTSCTPFANPPTCPANQWCGPPVGASTTPTCQTAGTGTANAMCTAAVPCAANFICSNTLMGGLCKQACQPGVPNSCPNGGVCTPLSGSMQFGTCP